MSIKMNELAQETKVKFQEAIADGRITAEEWKKFSKEEQELLSKGLGGKTPTVGDDIVIKTTKKAVQKPAPKAKKQERAELSWGEIGKQGLKSVGNFFKGMVCDEDGFSLTRTAATVGTAVAFAAVAAVSAPVALAAGAVLGGYMVYDGGKKAIEGTKEYYKATTHEEAVAAMEKAMDGGVETAGGVAALFGVKKGYSKVKAAKTQPKHQTIEEAVQSMKATEAKPLKAEPKIQTIAEPKAVKIQQFTNEHGKHAVLDLDNGSTIHLFKSNGTYSSVIGDLKNTEGVRSYITNEALQAILTKYNITL